MKTHGYEVRKIYQVILVGALVLCFAGTGTAAEILKWTGCGITKKAFMAELAKGYQKKTGVLVSLSGGGATKGIRDTNNQVSDMGGNCRPALPEIYPAEEGDVEMYMVAWDALVPVVNKKNPVTSITSRQLKEILTGKIVNWKEIGGKDLPILVVARQGKISGVGYMSRKMIFKDVSVDYTPNALLVKSSGPLENKISFDEMAIGVTGVSSAVKRIQSGKNMRILKVDGILPSKENIASGKYPFYRPLFLTANPKSSNYSKIKTFIEWVLSAEAQSIIDKVGTVNLKKGEKLSASYKYWESRDKIVNIVNEGDSSSGLVSTNIN